MKIVRWIFFLPAFAATEILIGYLAKICFKKIYNFAFPIEGIMDYIFVFPFASFFMLGVISIYLLTIAKVVSIAPNPKIGGAICLLYLIPSYIFDIFINVGPQHFKIKVAFLIITILGILTEMFELDKS